MNFFLCQNAPECDGGEAVAESSPPSSAGDDTASGKLEIYGAINQEKKEQ